MPSFFLLSYNPPKCLPSTSNPAPTCQALQIRPFLIKKDTLSVSLAGAGRGNSLLSSIQPMCVKIARSRPSGTTAESADALVIIVYDEFQRFIYATPTTVAKNDTHWNPINWWIDESKKGHFDTLHLYALDHLSCPAMATQCERVFSAARRTLTPERNALVMKVIEACECLRWWWRNGVVSGMPTVCPMTPRAVVEAQFITALVGDSASSDASEDGVD
jgi:hypothetical protein